MGLLPDHPPQTTGYLRQHSFGKKGGGADHYLDRVVKWLKLNGPITTLANPVLVGRVERQVESLDHLPN